MSSGTTGMNNTLGNPLMIEMMDLYQPIPIHGRYLLPAMMILQQAGTLLVTGNFEPDIGIINSRSGIGSKNRLLTGILLIITHLLELIIFLQLLHFLRRRNRATTQGLLRFLE